MHYSGKPAVFEDCAIHGVASGAELFIVEGDSASGAVATVRDATHQAVLPMQGKPLNALKASGARVVEYPLFKQLSDALGVAPNDIESGEVGDMSGRNFERVMLLFDLDADGIHSGVLMLMYFYRWMQPLLAAGAVWMVRPPLYVVTVADNQQSFHAYSPDHAARILAELKRRGHTDVQSHHHRGLASIDPTLLASSCLAQQTRKADVMTVADAEDAIRVFAALPEL
jgi:DNA gyrase subunit B/topoisomerase-4 subunit B